MDKLNEPSFQIIYHSKIYMSTVAFKTIWQSQSHYYFRFIEM